jgi:hypothetical protein
MITLPEKIKIIYPEMDDYAIFRYTLLRDDGSGPYIKEWNHPTLPRPTDAQLAEIE